MVTTLQLAKECILHYQTRCNEQGFYSPNKQPIVQQALKAIQETLNRQISDEEISNLWHQSNNQPFKFARLLEQYIKRI